MRHPQRCPGGPPALERLLPPFLLLGSLVACDGGASEAFTGPTPATQVQPLCSFFFDPTTTTLAETGDQLAVTIGMANGCDWTRRFGDGAAGQPISGGRSTGTIADTRNQ